MAAVNIARTASDSPIARALTSVTTPCVGCSCTPALTGTPTAAGIPTVLAPIDASSRGPARNHHHAPPTSDPTTTTRTTGVSRRERRRVPTSSNPTPRPIPTPEIGPRTAAYRQIVGASSVADSGLCDDPRRRDPHQHLLGHRIALPVLVRARGAHVAARDAGGPQEQLVGVVDDGRGAFDDDEGERRPLVV